MTPFALALLCSTPEAAAVDLDALVEAWTLTVPGQGGSDGIGDARDVALDADGNIWAVGYVDGAPGHDKDGYIVSYLPDGSVGWDLTHDAGALGPNQAGSNDRVESIEIDLVTGDVTWCGGLGGTGQGNDPEGWYWVEALTPAPVAGDPPDSLWEQRYRDGSASPIQSCFDATRAFGYVHAAGWGQHGADEGRWLSWRYVQATGLADPPYTYESTAFPAVPDQAYAVSVNQVTGSFAVVGTVGFAGQIGSDQNNSDWHVRFHDDTGALAWTDTHVGVSALEDAALATASDQVLQSVYVAGFENLGDDNGSGSDRDWLVIAYDDFGDGLGGSFVKWTHSFGTSSGFDEIATSVVIDDLGDLLVGGTTVDPVTGNAVWRIAKLSAYDGTEIQSWVGNDHGGDSMLQSLVLRDGKIAMVGSVDEGLGPRFGAAVIEGDRDADTVADSVDACPDDPLKSDDEGICGCNSPDDDSDGDGFANCIEDCPTDPDKQDPGICDCGEPDIDTDKDGFLDCQEECPGDPLKTEWGICGCGAPDSDTDGDGVVGCQDSCANTPPDTPVDPNGCPLLVTDTEDTGGPPTTDDSGGCGCHQGSGPLPWWAAVPWVLIWMRRRG